MTDTSTQVLPPRWTDVGEQVRRIVTAVNNILRGKTNNVGTVTLTANSATTTLTDIRIGINSVILLQPTTANASAEIGAGAIYFGTPGDGTVTINHANNAQTDRTFNYAVVG